MTDLRYSILRKELDYRLNSAELDGVPFDKAMGDLIKLSLALAVALDGPQRTEAQIQWHLDHMRESFPEMAWSGSSTGVSGTA